MKKIKKNKTQIYIGIVQEVIEILYKSYNILPNDEVVYKVQKNTTSIPANYHNAYGICIILDACFKRKLPKYLSDHPSIISPSYHFVNFLSNNYEKYQCTGKGYDYCWELNMDGRLKRLRALKGFKKFLLSTDHVIEK